jgi:hypothetical protein
MWKSRDSQQHTEKEIETRVYSEKLDKEDGGSEGRRVQNARRQNSTNIVIVIRKQTQNGKLVLHPPNDKISKSHVAKVKGKFF